MSTLQGESSSLAVERLATKRRLRHQDALHIYEEKIATIHQSMEERLFSLSREFSLQNEALDADLRRLLTAFSDEDFALACYQNEDTSESSLEDSKYPFPLHLPSLLSYLSKLNADRAGGLQHFEASLIAMEDTRKALVREQLSATTQELMSIAHLLPEEIERKFIGIVLM